MSSLDYIRPLVNGIHMVQELFESSSWQHLLRVECVDGPTAEVGMGLALPCHVDGRACDTMDGRHCRLGSCLCENAGIEMGAALRVPTDYWVGGTLVGRNYTNARLSWTSTIAWTDQVPEHALPNWEASEAKYAAYKAEACAGCCTCYGSLTCDDKMAERSCERYYPGSEAVHESAPGAYESKYDPKPEPAINLCEDCAYAGNTVLCERCFDDARAISGKSEMDAVMLTFNDGQPTACGECHDSLTYNLACPDRARCVRQDPWNVWPNEHIRHTASFTNNEDGQLTPIVF
jgi:hypothetical protein